MNLIEWQNILSLIYKFRWQDILDIIIVAYVIYRLFLLIRGTRAVQLLRGLVAIIAVYYIANEFLQLKIITWILQNAATMVIVAIPIIFQPELRRALAHIGQGTLLEAPFAKGKDFFQLMGILCTTAKNLSHAKTGALIIIERHTGLEEFIETGTRIDGLMTVELLSSIFYKGNPLHDGAVIIRGGQIISAGSLLPLTENIKSSKQHLGTRHRAAIGLSETSDALCVVVSEETGDISLAVEGKMHRHLNEETLHNLLLNYYQTKKSDTQFSLLQFLFKWKNIPKDEKGGLWKRWGLIASAVLIAVAFSLIIAFEQNIINYEKNLVLPIEMHDQIKLNVGKSVRMTPKYAILTVQGVKSSLDAIKSEDIKIYVELNKDSKSQMLELKTILPPDIKMKQIEPKEILVNIN